MKKEVEDGGKKCFSFKMFAVSLDAVQTFWLLGTQTNIFLTHRPSHSQVETHTAATSFLGSQS